MTVGAQSTTSASAKDSNYCTVYRSEGHPGRFTYQSSEPLVVSIDNEGRVSARAPGKAELTTVAEGFTSSPVRLMVSPRFAILRASARVPAVPVSDTVFITVRSYDSAGREVRGVWVWIPVYGISLSPHTEFQDYVRHLAPRLATPATFWFVPRLPGVLSFVASAPTRDGYKKGVSADTVRVTISPK